MSRAQWAIRQDPWIADIGFKIATTNVVDLEQYRRWTTGSPHIPRLGRVLRSTLGDVDARKRTRAARTLARRLADVEALAQKERSRRRKGGAS